MAAQRAVLQEVAPLHTSGKPCRNSVHGVLRSQTSKGWWVILYSIPMWSLLCSKQLRKPENVFQKHSSSLPGMRGYGVRAQLSYPLYPPARACSRTNGTSRRNRHGICTSVGRRRWMVPADNRLQDTGVEHGVRLEGVSNTGRAPDGRKRCPSISRVFPACDRRDSLCSFSHRG